MPIISITPTELKERLDSGEDILVVDVRNDHELEISKVDFAEHIVLTELPDRMEEVPKDKTVVMMCRSGGRSMQACNFLVQNGWSDQSILNLADGILGWARDVDPSLPTMY